MNDRLRQAQAGMHLPFLDGLRGLAVSYVLLYHFFPKTVSLGNDSAFFKVWDYFWLLGWTGVDLFFVLSGFLITGILYHSKGRSDYFSNFYARRFFRIFPAYYTLILIAVVYSSPERPSLFYWAYLANFDTELNIAFHPFLCVAWSLSIEEQYYLFYPTVVRVLSERRWLQFLASLVVLSVAVRWLGHVSGYLTPRQMYHNTLAHFDGIALGGLLRLMLYRANEFQRILAAYVRITPVLIIGSLLFGFWCSAQVLNEFAEAAGKELLGHVSFLPPMYLVGYSLNTLCFGGIILCCIFRDGLLYRLASAPLLRHIGKYSYAMYLFQFPASFFFYFVTDSLGITVNPFADGVLRFGVDYLFARISWTLIESPMFRLRDSLGFRAHAARRTEVPSWAVKWG